MSRLTQYQRDALALAGQGMTYEQSAAALGRSKGSVRSALNQARLKLGARSTTQAILLAEVDTPTIGE